MYTECPHCHAIFRVTQEILKAAGGKVRCGECKSVFQAVKPPQSETPPVTASADGAGDAAASVSITADTQPSETFIAPSEQQLGLTQDSPVPAAASEASGNPVNSDTATAPDDHSGSPATDSDEPAETVEPSATPVSGYNASEIRSALKQKQPDAVTSQSSFHHAADHRDDDDGLAHADTPGAPPTGDDTPRSHSEITAALPGYMPVAAPTEAAPRKPVSLWVKLLIPALLLLLLGQYLVINRNTLSTVSGLQPVLQGLCKVAGCTVEGRREIASLRLVNHGVYSHPTVNDALMIKAEIVNEATFAQPYPVIEVSFSDLRGKPVALRRFGPSEYLDPQQSHPDKMPPNQIINIVLEVADPGKHALAFEFEFL